MAAPRSRRLRLTLERLASAALVLAGAAASFAWLGPTPAVWLTGVAGALLAAAAFWIASWQPAQHWALPFLCVPGALALLVLLWLGGAMASASGIVWALAVLVLLGFTTRLLLELCAEYVAERGVAAPALHEVLPDDLRRGRWLVVLIRHAGCTFCRETLATVAPLQAQLRAKGHRLAIVHMGDRDTGAELARRYGLVDALWLADPERRLYRALSLPRGRLGQLFGLRMVVRGFVAGVLRGHGVGTLDGDGFQLGGHAVLHDGQVVEVHRARDAADLGDLPEHVGRLPAAG